MLSIKVKMARGGYLNLNADGHVYKDSYGSGESGIFCDDFRLYWPGGGQVNPQNVADMDQALSEYIKALERG